jgi:hypothetical protein
MIDHRSISDDEYLAAFLEHRVPVKAFDHYGHVRVAWLLLRRCSVVDAVEQMCKGIAALAKQAGAPEKYHRTISEALMRLIAHGGAMDTRLSWEDFVRSNPKLLSDVRGLLAEYYSTDRLMSLEARMRFVQPDLQPLPA